MPNNAGEILDHGMDPTENELDYDMDGDGDERSEEIDQAAERLEKICRYSHKILKKYVCSGMITIQDGPQLHALVNARDYRIICILEVYSQNKNEDDFLENLGLLTQVIKEQNELEQQEAAMYSDFELGEVEQTEHEEVQQDSFSLTLEEATQKGFLSVEACNWSIDQKKAENRRVVLSYNAYKKFKDLQDFSHTLSRLFANSGK